MPTSDIADAIAAFARGEFLIVADDEDRENEGDLILAGSAATPEKLAFMVRHTSGVICAPLEAERLDALQLPQMVASNAESHRTAYAISVDAAAGVTSGISAADRARTVRLLADPVARPEDFVRPGHVFPLRARPGGVLARAGHTEATVDLSRLAGLEPAGILCELVNDDGSMQRMPDLDRFSREHGIHLITIADLIAHRRQSERLVERTTSTPIATKHGPLVAHAFHSSLDGGEHLAFTHGDPSQPDVLVRVHVSCFAGEVLGSDRCDCGEKLDAALGAIATAPNGVLVYLRGAESRTLDHGAGGPRDYGIGAQILAELGVTRMRLLTDSAPSHPGLGGFDLEITERVPLPPADA